jgi:hypothetical protein
MKIRRISAVIAIAMLATTAMVGTATAATKASTTVTIKAEGSDYSGTVKSSKLKKCADGRKVVLFKQKGAKQDPKNDKKIGSDTANLMGNKAFWSTGNSGIYGKIYARAAATANCKAASSKTIKTTAPNV